MLTVDDGFAYAVTRVAHYFGRDWFAQAARPMHETYFALLRLEEAERIAAVRKRGEMLDEAYLTNYAVNDPKRLEAEQRAYRTETTATARPRTGPLSDEERRRVAAIMASVAAHIDVIRAA